jgi:hypothetical protein
VRGAAYRLPVPLKPGRVFEATPVRCHTMATCGSIIGPWSGLQPAGSRSVSCVHLAGSALPFNRKEGVNRAELRGLLAGLLSPIFLLRRRCGELRRVQRVGTKLGPYEILALIGKGGMGDVYKARDTAAESACMANDVPCMYAVRCPSLPPCFHAIVNRSCMHTSCRLTFGHIPKYMPETETVGCRPCSICTTDGG